MDYEKFVAAGRSQERRVERTTDVSSQKRERLLPYTAEQLFHLAADVERYPEYLRWWIAARIRKREANVYCTDQVLGLGPVRVRFGSRTVLQTVLQPPTRIDVTSKDYPFHTLLRSQPENFSDR